MILVLMLLLSFPACAEEIQSGVPYEMTVRATVVETVDNISCQRDPTLPGCEFFLPEEPVDGGGP